MELIVKKSLSVTFLFVTSVFFTNVFSQKEGAVKLLTNSSTSIITKYIYGHFAEHLGRCIYDGFYKDGKIRMDVVDALKKINVPLLRWPGGCFADQYHWQDGIGPKSKRPSRVNTNWGMVVEDNTFGTDEFMQLCKLLNCEPYIAGNIGSGTPSELQGWLEYLNYAGKTSLTKIRAANGYTKPYNVSFVGVGNESWGCGGNMTPEYYTDQYKEYASYCVDYPGTKLKKISSGGYGAWYNWTEAIMKNIPADQLWGMSVHYYVFPGDWNKKGSATNFDEAEYFTSMKKALFMDSLIVGHSRIMDKYDPQKKVALCIDEWGIWTDVEPGTNKDFLYQQNSLRDALIAATTLNIFNNHCDRVRMANLAQTVNVLQALILTKGNDMLLTPTYHVFDLYKVHQDAQWLPVNIDAPKYFLGNDSIPAINVSASKDKNGIVHISLVNLDPVNDINVKCNLAEIEWKNASAKILSSGKVTDINTFSEKNKVIPKQFTSFSREGDQLTVELPAKSVVVVEIRN